MKITKSQIWVSRKFFSENIFHRKKKSRKFLCFLQRHTLGSYLTQYDHPTQKTREVRSLEKNCFTFFNLRLDILDDLRSDNDMHKCGRNPLIVEALALGQVGYHHEFRSKIKDIMAISLQRCARRAIAM